MIGYSKKLNLKVVLCHGDTHPGNMVWNEEDGEITFVDWEITHIGYQAHDIEYFLRFFASMEEKNEYLPDLPKFASVPPFEITREKFINFYVEAYLKLTTGSTSLSDEYMKEFKNHAEFIHLMLGLTSVILFGSVRHKLVDAGLPAEAVKLIAVTFEKYRKSKDEILRELNLK